MIQRYFIPGGEWLYVKLYTGPKTAERLLADHIYPLTEEWIRSGRISRYFYLRYGDPEFHLRLRFRIAGGIASYAAVWSRLHDVLSACMASGLVSNVCFDTYQREIERYGAATMELSETLFCIDSRYILHILSLLPQDAETDPETLRWELSLQLVDDLLDAFLYDIREKAALMSQLAESFRREFDMTQRAFTRQINEKYRNLRPQINSSLDPLHSALSRYAPLLHQRRSEIAGMQPAFREALAKQAAPDLDTLLQSYIHMTMNRIFRSHNRKCELVIYDFMQRYYKSRLAYPATDPIPCTHCR